MEKNKECKEFDSFKKEIERLIETLSVDADKFYNKGQKAAGVRLRKGYKQIKSYVDSVSKETQPKKVTE